MDIDKVNNLSAYHGRFAGLVQAGMFMRRSRWATATTTEPGHIGPAAVRPAARRAGVSLRRGVLLVAADAREMPTVGTADLNFEAAVALAQDARRFLPGTRHRQTSLVRRLRWHANPSPARWRA